MQTTFIINKAQYGDSILIRTFDQDKKEFNILIDGGPSITFHESLLAVLSSVKTIHLLVLTHIDSDHIGGLINFLRSPVFKQIEVQRYWFNSKNLLKIAVGTEISLTQARDFEDLLIMHGESPSKYTDIVISESQPYQLAKGITATVISPNEYILKLLYEKWPDLDKGIFKKAEDQPISAGKAVRRPELSLKELAAEEFQVHQSVEKDIFNSSSIAFILELPDCKLLLLGDARSEIMVEALKAKRYNNTDNKLKVDYVKVSHHGSRNNTSSELLDLIDCQNYIISTNGGQSKHKHPDRDVIARIVYHPARDMNKKVNIFFNYSLSFIESLKGPICLPADKEAGNWTIIDNKNQFSANYVESN